MHIQEEIREKVEDFLESETPNMAHALGIEFESFAKDEVRATMPVHGPTKQPFGLLHGGASVALAETLASIGAWLNIQGNDHTAVGLEINANHIKAVRSGTVRGVATPIHRGAQTQVWETRITTESGKLVCISRCTLAIIKHRS
jgi:1,4-dihydroxy-2-naphthoyl-CoA hydrolase